MGSQLVALVVEQRRLRRKQHPTDTSKWTCRLALIVLRANTPAEEKGLTRREHLEAGRHRWRCNSLCAGRLRERKRKRHDDSRETRDARVAAGALVVACL